MANVGAVQARQVGLVQQAAQQAAATGQAVFVARLNTFARRGNKSGEVLDWGPMVEAIEAEGWALSEWAIGGSTRGPAAYPLFRRSGIS